ncbi:MAG: hypothetical protein Q8M07_09820, partial [Prosthecobacter sp.]|nr:hypothetical protein [Prosthecobacter sp.]
MRILSLAAAFVAMSLAGEALAQAAAPAPAAPPRRELSPEDKALNDSLTAFIKSTPELGMQRDEITVPMKLAM